MMTYNKPYYGKLIENWGYRKVARHVRLLGPYRHGLEAGQEAVVHQQ